MRSSAKVFPFSLLRQFYPCAFCKTICLCALLPVLFRGFFEGGFFRCAISLGRHSCAYLQGLLPVRLFGAVFCEHSFAGVGSAPTVLKGFLFALVRGISCRALLCKINFSALSRQRFFGALSLSVVFSVLSFVPHSSLRSLTASFSVHSSAEISPGLLLKQFFTCAPFKAFFRLFIHRCFFCGLFCGGVFGALFCVGLLDAPSCKRPFRTLYHKVFFPGFYHGAFPCPLLRVNVPCALL